MTAIEAKVPLSEWYLLMDIVAVHLCEVLEMMFAHDGFGGVGGELGVHKNIA